MIYLVIRSNVNVNMSQKTFKNVQNRLSGSKRGGNELRFLNSSGQRLIIFLATLQ